MRSNYLFIFLTVINCFFAKDRSINAQTRERLSFNDNWLFKKTEAQNAHQLQFDDSSWRKLSVPHDWAIEGPFKPEYNLRTGGLPVFGSAWYRKHFTIDASKKDGIVELEFDGIMGEAVIYINGQKIYNRPNGYIGYEIDITPYVNYNSDNVIAVFLNPKVLSARWYPGAGIYRNTWITYKNKVHIQHWGTQITTQIVTDTLANVNVFTKIDAKKNLKQATIQLLTKIVDANRKEIAQQMQPINFGGDKTVTAKQSLTITNPNKWNLQNPYLYTVVSVLLKNGKEIDTYETPFGVRSIQFSKDGFFINGRKEKLKGVCLHHDLGPLGAAVNFRATQRQLEIMKQMGVNAIRTSHNPPSPEQLMLCDQMGLLVQVEAFDGWQEPKTENDYGNFFEEWHEVDIRDMIKRDRNHPSVIMWSIGNEVKEQKNESGKLIAKKLVQICKEEDTTRPITAGFNHIVDAIANGLTDHLDIVGANYKPFHYDKLMRLHPNKLIYGSETASTVSTRGVYHLPLTKYDKHVSLQVNSYDFNSPSWAYPPDIEFFAQDANDDLFGEFMWTGFDYLGEPTPYGGKDNLTHGNWHKDWPSRSSYFGAVDLAGFPKDRFYLYQSKWTTQPMVHILPHWNWDESKTKSIPVYCYTNAEAAELFVNGKSYGIKTKGVDKTKIPVSFYGWDKTKKHFESPYRLSWEVPYEAGELKVVAYNNQKQVAEKIIKTAQKPAQISLKADRVEIAADGSDLSFITVSIQDEFGVFHPLASNIVEFTVTGPATIAAVGNGDPTSTEPFQAAYRKAFNGLCLLVIKSKKGEAGSIKVEAKSNGLASSHLKIKSQ